VLLALESFAHRSGDRLGQALAGEPSQSPHQAVSFTVLYVEGQLCSFRSQEEIGRVSSY
jgi:hypothetical protein